MNFGVLLAAGSSSRFAASCPEGTPDALRDKLHGPLLPGMPVWRLSFDLLAGHPEVSAVGIVCPPGDEGRFQGAGAAFVVEGGATRLESARRGVAAVPADSEVVLVHDAARPLASPALVSRVLAAARKHGAAVPAIPIEDTLKRGPEFVLETVDRSDLFRVQTPQAARRDWLLDALLKAEEATDEAAALELAGYPVKLVEGAVENVKITTFADLERVLDLGFDMTSATGIGYDVHPFSDDPKRPLVLGGVLFPDERGLAGHSDADAVLHAVTDALLGAGGLGDIGRLFPDTDPAWKDADSRIFLREAVRRLKEGGARVGSVDVTVIAERPKIGPRRKEMEQVLAKELGIEPRRSNVKATTHEGLGAIGRGEGIAAIAVATVHRRSKRS
ncbi:MAG: 2-C-methyl-D-erythritol 2,4-cyclodiphosphate synthase [Armatimonadetes bacterium]|nr:2-C-methyl-D-erythritol 2,4-cyclodiphosphate synthase [Armatimonadota bacterium]